MPPKPWAASFKVNKDTGGAEGNVFWGSTCWWMIVVLQRSPSQAPQCQLPWQVCLSFLLAVQNLPTPARCSVCKALNSRKPVLSLTPHRAIHPCKLNPQKCSWNTTKCVLLLSVTSVDELLCVNSSITFSTRAELQDTQHISDSTSTTTLPCGSYIK